MVERYDITIEVSEKEGVKIYYKNHVIYANPATKRCDIITLLKALDRVRGRRDES